MKITLDTKTFVEAIQFVTKAYDQTDSGSYVALTVTESGEGKVHHGNSTTFMLSPISVIETKIDAEELEDGAISFALDGKFLQKLAPAIAGSGPSIVLSRKAGDVHSPLEVKTSTGKFTIPVFDKKIAKVPELIELGEVDDREYFDTLQRLAKMCDQANAGAFPALGCVDIKLDVDNKELISMATDRYSLGEIKISFDPSEAAAEYIEENPNLLLPGNNAQLITPSKGLTSSTTLVHETKGQKFGYVFGDERVALFSLTKAKVIPYLNIKNKASAGVKNQFTVKTSELKKAISTVSTLAWDETQIYFKILNDEVVVCDSHGTNKVSVPIEDVQIDNECTATFVRSVVNGAFHPISTEKMVFKWLDEKTSFIIESQLDDGTVLDSVFVLLTTYT